MPRKNEVRPIPYNPAMKNSGRYRGFTPEAVQKKLEQQRALEQTPEYKAEQERKERNWLTAADTLLGGIGNNYTSFMPATERSLSINRDADVFRNARLDELNADVDKKREAAAEDIAEIEERRDWNYRKQDSFIPQQYRDKVYVDEELVALQEKHADILPTGGENLLYGASSVINNVKGAPAYFGESISNSIENNTRVREAKGFDEYAEKTAALADEAQLAQAIGDYEKADAIMAEMKELDAQFDELKTPTPDTGYGAQTMKKSAYQRDEVMTGLGKQEQFIAGTAMSIAQNAAFAPAGAVSVWIPLGLMGMSAASQKSYELAEQGINSNEALVRGVISGLIEIATERIPLENLLKLAKGGDTNALKAILWQIFTEASEESVSYIAGDLVDRAFNDPNVPQTWKEYFAGLGEAVLGGALSGGVMGSGATAIGSYRTARYRNGLIDALQKGGLSHEDARIFADAYIQEQEAQAARGDTPLPYSQNDVTGDLNGQSADAAGQENSTTRPIPKIDTISFWNSEYKNDPDRIAAKQGDVQAARRLVEKMVTPEFAETVRQKYKGSTIVPVVDMVGESKTNALPQAFAEKLSDMTDLTTTSKIIKINTTDHANAKNAFERMTQRARFSGEIVPNQKYYLIADDFVSVGSTIADLKAYIESKGGEVVGAVTLSASAEESLDLTITDENVRRLEAYGREGIERRLNDFGIADKIESLTNAEARSILSALDKGRLAGRSSGQLLQSLSDGIAKAKGRGDSRNVSKQQARLEQQNASTNATADAAAFSNGLSNATKPQTPLPIPYNPALKGAKPSQGLIPYAYTSQEAKAAGIKGGLDRAQVQTYNAGVESGLSKTDALSFANISKKAEVNIEFDQNLVGEAEYDFSTGTITVNPKTVTKRRTAGLLAIHELMHRAETSGLYENIKSFIFNSEAFRNELSERRQTFEEYRDEIRDAYNEKIAAANENGAPYSLYDDAMAETELVAKFAEKYLSDQSTINRIVSQDRTLGERIRDFFDDLITRFTGTQYEKEFVNIRDMLNKALGEASRTAAKGDGGTRFHISANASLDIDRAITEKSISASVRLRDYTPTALVNRGIPDKPMYMKPTHIRENILSESEAKQAGFPVNDKTHYHGLGKQLFMEAIDGLDKPIAVYRWKDGSFKNYTSDDYIVITSQKDGQGNTIIVPIVINSTAEQNNAYIDVNEIKSVYGKKDLNKYIERYTRQRALSKVKERSPKTNAEVQFPEIGKSASTTDYAQNNGKVNTKKKHSFNTVHYAVNTEHISPDRINPPNEPADSELLDYLVDDYKENGYNGRPVVVVGNDEQGYQAITGSHRIAAAREAGIDIPSVVVPYDYENRGLFELMESNDDDDRARIAEELFERGDISQEARDLIVRETQLNSDNWGIDYDKQVRFSFAGENAKTADKAALKQAKYNDDAGMLGEMTRKDTGWFKGADGKWRFEISDKDAKLISNPQGNTLSDYLDHSELYKAYPELKKLKVEFSDNLEVKGRLSGNTIKVRTGVSDLKSVLIHEVQHYIQTKESFNRGANRRFGFALAFIDAYNDVKGAVEFKNAKKNEKADVVLNRVIAVSPDGTYQGAAREQYYKIAGEVEARDAQRRIGYSDKERRNTPPDTSGKVVDPQRVVDEFIDILRDFGYTASDAWKFVEGLKLYEEGYSSDEFESNAESPKIGKNTVGRPRRRHAGLGTSVEYPTALGRSAEEKSVQGTDEIRAGAGGLAGVLDQTDSNPRYSFDTDNQDPELTEQVGSFSGARKQKMSKVASNTYDNTPMFTVAEKNAAQLGSTNSDYTYDVEGEQESLQNALVRVQNDYEGEQDNLQRKAEFDGEDTDTAMFILQTKMNEAKESGDYSEVRRWSKLIQERGTEAGKRIQAFAKYTRTVEGTLVKIDCYLKKRGDDWAGQHRRKAESARELASKLAKMDTSKITDAEMSDAQRREAIADGVRRVVENSGVKKLSQENIDELAGMIARGADVKTMREGLNSIFANGFAELTDAEIDAITKLFEKAEQYGEFSKERAEIESAAYSIVAQKMPSTAQERWDAWRYLAMLGNTRTHIRNMVGNTAFGEVVKTKNTVAAVIEKAAIAAGINITPTKDFLNPFSESDRTLIDAAKADGNEVYALLTSGGKYGVVGGINAQRQVFKTKALNILNNLNSGALEAEDFFALKNAYGTALAGYMKANKMTPEMLASDNAEVQKRVDRAREYAINEAQKATFRNVNAVASAISRMSNDLKKNGAAGKFASAAVEGVVPFKNTPANIIARGVEYSPVGLITTITKGVFDVADGNITANQFIDKLAANLTGSAIFGIGWLLAELGFVSGGGDEEEKQNKFDKAQGKQNYALNIGGKSYTLDWAAPFSLPLFIGVETCNWFKNRGVGERGLNGLLSTAMNIAEPMLEMTMLQGVNNMFESLAYAKENQEIFALLGTAMTNYATQGVPTVLGQIARSVDDTRRSTYTGKSGVEGDLAYTLKKTMNKLPFASKFSEPYVDLWGREQQNAGGNAVGRLALNMLSPGYYAEENVTPVDEFVQSVYDATGDVGVLPNTANSKITINGVTRRMTPHEYTNYAKESGQMAYKIIDEMRGLLEGASDDEKARAIENAYEIAQMVGKQRAIIGYEISNQKLYNIYKQGGVKDVALYSAYYDRVGQFEGEGAAANKREFLMTDNSLSAAEKKRLDQLLIYTNTKVDYTDKDTFILSQMSESAQKKYDYADALGYGTEQYKQYYSAYYTDTDDSGNTTKTEGIQNLIDAGMTESEAYDFYNAVIRGKGTSSGGSGGRSSGGTAKAKTVSTSKVQTALNAAKPNFKTTPQKIPYNPAALEKAAKKTPQPIPYNPAALKKQTKSSGVQRIPTYAEAQAIISRAKASGTGGSAGVPQAVLDAIAQGGSREDIIRRLMAMGYSREQAERYLAAA